MLGINSVSLLGCLGKDPDIRNTTGGSTVATLSLCTNERIRDREGNWSDHAEWHRVTVFGRSAELVRDFCKMGSKLAVLGKLRTTSYEKDGVTRYSTEVIANSVHFIDSDQGGGEEPDQENNQLGRDQRNDRRDQGNRNDQRGRDQRNDRRDQGNRNDQRGGGGRGGR